MRVVGMGGGEPKGKARRMRRGKGPERWVGRCRGCLPPSSPEAFCCPAAAYMIDLEHLSKGLCPRVLHPTPRQAQDLQREQGLA